MMLISIVPAIAPVASATHGGVTVAPGGVDIKTATNGTIVGTLASAGTGAVTSVRFNIVADVPPCAHQVTTETQPAAAGTVIATVETGGIITTANEQIALERDATGTLWRGSRQFNVAGSLTPGLEASAHKFKVDITLAEGACPAVTHHAPTGLNDVEVATAVSVDTKAPEWTGDNAAWYYHDDAIAARSRAASGPIGTGTIGSFVRFNVSATDGSTSVGPLTYKRNIDSLVGGANGLLPTNPILHNFEINASVAGTPPPHNPGTPGVIVQVEDVWGNVLSKTITTSVDNVRPAPANFDVGRADLRLSQRTPLTTGSEFNEISFNWQSSDADIAFAQVRVKTPSLAFWPIGNVSEPASATAFSAAQKFTIPDDPLTPWDENLRTAFEFAVLPVDAAGNVGTTPQRAITFPQMDVNYGLLGDSPAFLGGNAVGNVYVNLTANAPPTPLHYPADLEEPIGPTAPGALYGQLVREQTGSLSYWKVNTAGGNGDFVTESRQVPQDAASTVFRPGARIMTHVAGTPIVLNNMSTTGHTRNFIDGSYQLQLTLSTVTSVADPTDGKNVTHILRFRTDSGDPTSGNHPLYKSPAIGTVGSSTNMTQLHGMDGNPFRVVFHVSDERNETVGAQAETYVLRDSGLRNVTFELIDKNSNVVQRTRDGSFARVNLNVTAGSTDSVNVPAAIYDMRTIPTTPPAGGCPADLYSVHANKDHPYCVWREISETGEWRATFYNKTRYAGWVNLTWPDLPSGNYSVRVLAYDQAGRAMSAKIYQSGVSEYYSVAPAVKLVSSINSPLVRADNKLDVVVAASQLYFVPPAEIAALCVSSPGSSRADLCPASQVRIYVSNSDAAGQNGVLYETRSFASTLTPALNQPPEYVKGFTGGYFASCATTSTASKGILEFCDPTFNPGKGFPLRYFEYTHDSIEALPTIPSSINLAQPIYVRAEAVTQAPDGTEIVKRTTGWTRAVTSTTPSLSVNQPPVEWSLNLTNDAITNAVVKPPFNVSFDRKSESPVPKARIVVEKWSEIVASEAPGGPAVTPELVLNDVAPRTHANGADARYLFNWTGFLTTTGVDTGAQLPAGAYVMKVVVYDGTWPLPSGQAPLATTWRNFTILAAKPTLVFDPTQAGNPGILKPSGSNVLVASTSFDATFTVNQGETNLTSLDQLKFRLKRNSDSSITENGQNGFNVVVRGTVLDPSLQQNVFTIGVTLPSNVPNGNRFQLNATANLDVAPWTIGNSSGFLDFIVDKQPPVGSVYVGPTENTVSAGGTPPKNKVGAALKPSFEGFAEDLGAGASKVEVRIVDLTTSETLELVANGNGVIPREGTNLEYWASSEQLAGFPAGTSMVELGPAGAVRTWSIPLVDRAPLPALYDPATDTGPLSISHTYRLDVRVTDALGQVSAINSTTIDFDKHSPYLGYKTQLDVPITRPSGITVSPAGRTSVNWHGANGDSLNLAVVVTDNHCIAAVRLVGNSSVNPSVTVKANMTPYQLPTGSDNYAITEASKICPNGKSVGYQIDIGSARTTTGQFLLDDVGNYTFWFEAEDYAGQISEVETNHRLLKIEVLDSSPATLEAVWFDPPVGQAGGRTTIRARVFENLEVSHVTVKIGNLTANMTEEQVSSTGSGVWRLDTTDDLGLTLDVGEYVFTVTPFDIHWNRTINPTCPQICFGQSPLYLVRDDGAPSVLLDSPLVGATLNATPTLKFRALHKALETTQITVKATTDGNETNLTAVAATELNFTELKGTNGTRQGWTVTYTPGTTLADNTTLIVNVSAALASLVDAKQYSFVVDSQAPSVVANVTGTQTIANKTYAVRATRVVLVANDTVSTPSIKYSVNGAAEQTYTGEITPAGPDGEWKLEYWATDPAGNIGPKQLVALNLDGTGPRITVAKHGDEVLLTVTDGTGVGLNESTVTVHYRYGAATAFSTKKADKLTGNSFGATLPGNATEDGLAYYFSADDLLGNVGSNFSAASPYKIAKESVTPANLPPTIRITAPTAGASVRNSVDLRWLAEDPEESPLTISIALRDPAPGRVLVAAGDNSGSYTVNTTGFAAGPYTVVVTVNDGENSASAQVTFTVESGEVIQVRNVPPATVLSNTPISVAVALSPTGKTVAQATYRLLKDGVLSTSGLLTPQQGLYAAGFTPTESGNYTVVVEVVYTDGTTEPAKQVASFRVPAQTTPPGGPSERGVFPVSLMALVAIAILTVALGAYGAFGRWKK